MATYADLGTSKSHPLGENTFGYKMEKGAEQELPIVLALTRYEFTRLRHEQAHVDISGQLSYSDIFTREHTLNWTALLQGEGLLTVRQY